MKMKRDYSLEDEPGEGNQLLTHELEVEDVMSLVIFLRDKNGIHFTLEDAPTTQCSDLVQLVIQDLELPPESSDIFCLWLVSPILELRLKKHHNPFQVVHKWSELCARYTNASAEEIQRSEPVLMLQRDVFLTNGQEQEIQDEKVLSLLYHEAQSKVVDKRYILHEEDYHQLAGIQALIEMGPHKQNQHPLSQYKSQLAKYYPDRMYAHHKFKFLNRASTHHSACEVAFMAAHRQLSQELNNLPSSDNKTWLYKKYLQILWTYPFYGGAFFHGAVEAKMTGIRRFILPKTDMKVVVCINTEGVSVFSPEKDEFLLYVPYSQLSWSYQDLIWDGDNDPPPTLMLQFICEEKSEDIQEQPVTKLLQIYSREAKLMDALIQTCVDTKLEEQKSLGLDAVDAKTTDVSRKKLLNKLDRLSLETYTQEGDQLETA